MPIYAFELRDGSSPVTDDTGVRLADRDHAFAYAQQIVLELMKGCEARTRNWRLDVYEAGKGLLFRIPFIDLDPVFADLDPSIRKTLVRLCDNHRSLGEAVHAARQTIRESRAVVARSRGRPYLATMAGEKTIRN
jgi:hypothetical protein